MNQVQLIGRMARDPELRRTEKGTPVVSFALAVDRRFQRDAVDFIDCVAWRSTAEFVDKYFRKGKRVALTGSIQVRKWKDKEGNDRKTVEVVADSVEFADGKDQGAGSYAADQMAAGGRRRRRRTSVLTHPRRKAVKRMDQNEKEEKRKAWVRFRVMDVLRNHDQEARVIESQIAAERAALAEDLKEILESAFPSSQLSDAGVRVQSSPDPDARMVNMVTRTEKRRNTADRRIGALERQAQQIEDVLSAILDMDSQSKCVLLALYYPFRSYKEAADFLHMAKATIYRQRKTALDSLFATMYKSDSFR